MVCGKSGQRHLHYKGQRRYWEHHLSGLVKALEIDPNNHNVVYASSGSDLYKSVNQGVTGRLSIPFPLSSRTQQGTNDSPTAIDSLLVSSVYGDIYVGLASTFHHGRVYKSSDGGATWTISFETEYGQHIWDIEEDPINGYLYFCTENPSHTANALVMRSKIAVSHGKTLVPDKSFRSRSQNTSPSSHAGCIFSHRS